MGAEITHSQGQAELRYNTNAIYTNFTNTLGLDKHGCFCNKKTYNIIYHNIYTVYVHAYISSGCRGECSCTSEDVPGVLGLLKAQSVVCGHQGFQLLGSGYILTDLRSTALTFTLSNPITAASPCAVHPHHMEFIELKSFPLELACERKNGGGGGG